MMKKQLLILFCFTIFSWQSNAQQECGIEDLTPEDAAQLLLDVQSMSMGFVPGDEAIIPVGPITVPFQPHIIRDNAGTGGADPATVLANINAAALHYLPYGILLDIKPILYVDRTDLLTLGAVGIGGSTEGDANLPAYNVANHANAYFIPTILSGSGSGNPIGGYARFPWMTEDYFTIANGNLEPNGATVAHEMGHYFGLLHTFEPFYGLELVNGSNCVTTGDLLCDTPADGRHTFSDVNSGTCAYSQGTDANGDAYAADETQIMSYNQPFSCVSNFSAEAEARMRFYMGNDFPDTRSYLFSPTAVCMNTSVTLNVGGTATITAADLDGGSSDPNGSPLISSVSPSSFTSANLGANSVTLTVTNSNGFASTCTGTVIVLGTPPTAVCQDYTAELNAAGNVTITGANVDGGSSDLESGVTLSVSPATFNCSHVGTPQTVTLTVTDDTGLTDTCTATVTVADSVLPEVLCQDITVELDANGNASIIADDVIAPPPVPGYSIDQTGAFSPINISGTGTDVSLGDDQVSGDLPVGFTFNFFGNDYTDFRISSNGFIGFDGLTDNGCCSGDFIPAPTTPNNIIAMAWEDLDPGNGGQPAINVVRYSTEGVAPNRILIVEFFNVDHFSAGNNVTTQAQLYEGSNLIEIHTLIMPSDGGNHTQGIENADGTVAYATPGRNSTNWSASNDYVAFMPLSAINPSDNCGVDTVTVSPSSFDCSNVGANTVTITVTDVNGNVGTCTATVTVEDNIDPVITCQDITVELDASGSVTISEEDVLVEIPTTVLNMISSSGDNGSSNPGLTDFTAPVLTTQTLTFDWTYTTPDGALFDTFGYLLNGAYTQLSNSSGSQNQNGAASVNVTVGDVFGFRSRTIDNIEGAATTTVSNFVPGFDGDYDPANWTLSLTNSDGNASFQTVTAFVYATDNCGIASITLDETSFDCSNVGPNTVIVTVVDVNGNTVTCTSTVTVEDNIFPEWVIAPADLTVECDGAGNVTEFNDWLNNTFTGTDNCPNWIITNDSTGLSDDCGETGTETVAFTLTDESGNFIELDATFTIVDTVDPFWDVAPSNLTVECDGAGNIADFDAWLNSTFSGSDTCSGLAVVTNNSTGLSDGCGETGTETVTFTLTDDCDNFIVLDATFTIVDTVDPFWDVAPSNLTVECDGAGNIADFDAWLNSTFSGSDTCSGLAVVTNNSTGLSDGCGETGTETVTFTLTDDCDNFIVLDATFTIVDTVDPFWDVAPADLTVECDGAGNTAEFDAWLNSTFSGSDTCSGLAVVTNNSTGLSDGCGETGTETVTFTLTDDCDNFIVLDATFTIVDTVDPFWDVAPSDLTVECDGAGNTAEFDAWLNSTFSGSDTCSGLAVVTNNSTGLSDGCGETGTETVTFTLTDDCDNFIVLDATFTIVDTVDPFWDVAPSNLTVECDGAGNTAEFDAWLNSTFSGSDTCSGLAVVTNNSTGLSDDCGETGTETVTFTLTDDCDNFIVLDATFTIEDTTPAIIGCPGDVTAFTEEGDCGAIVNFQNAVAIEECGDVIVYQTAGLGSGSVFPIGDTLIEFTAQDSCGNLSTCEFTITVVDDDAPDAVCQNITVQLDDMGSVTITAGQINFGSSDNCGVDTIEIDIDTFDCSNVGENTVILTVTDVNGNTSTCTATVTVEDVTAPEITCNDITVELGADGTVTIDPMDVAAGSSDACGIATYELNIDTFTCLDVGNSTVILTVTDVNGNQSSCSATVTVEDNTAPDLVCMDVTLELNEDGIAYIIPSQLADVNDPCGILVLTADVDELTCADIGTPVTVNIFANDGNGNTSFCSSTVTVVDVLGPQIVCPPNETVNLDPNGTYTLGDYIGDGIATVSDNCTDPVTIFTQDPAAGTLLGFGVNVITFTAEDEYGNVSTCSFNLNVEEILGANDTEDFASLVLYPNPADSRVHLSNPRLIDLSDVTIYDLTGRMVNKVDLTNMGSEITIDVSTLANATYMLIIKGSQGTSTKQLIVNN